VAWVDTDAAQVAHFSNYFRYFERAEQELFNTLGLDMLSLGTKYQVWFPRVEAHCRYLHPCKLNDVIDVELHASVLTEKAIRYEFKIHNISEGKLAAEGYSVVVAASSVESKAVPIPQELVTVLKSRLETS
jgi:acyl-CoA thioester hydrolase